MSSSELVQSINQIEDGRYKLYMWDIQKIVELLAINNLKKFKRYFKAQKGLKLEQFAKFLVTNLGIEQEQAVYFVSGVIQFFDKIHNNRPLPGNGVIQWKDFTQYLLEYGFSHIMGTHSNKLVDNKNNLRPDAQVFGGNKLNIGSLFLSTKYCDNYHHPEAIKNSLVAFGSQFLIILGNLQSYFTLYYNDSRYFKTVYTKDFQQENIVILEIAWSKKELRIGAVLRNYMLGFWDCLDNFTFDKYVDTQEKVVLLQTKIWYISFGEGAWLTTDKSFKLYEWNIIDETCRPWALAHYDWIINLIELKDNLIASSALDRSIAIWDFFTKTSLSSIQLSNVSAHTMVFSYDFDIMISIGYEKNVKLWSIEQPRDCVQIGQLDGHVNTLTSVTVIRGTPVCVSADDKGTVKTWDLRSRQNLQTLNMEGMVINKLHFIPFNLYLCAVGKRIYWFEFRKANKVNQNGMNNKEFYIISLKYSESEKELIIIGQSDIRVLNCYTGQLSRVLANTQGKDTEATCATLSHESNQVLIGYADGSVKQFRLNNGAKTLQYRPHNSEIISIFFCEQYKLILTATYDNSIKIYQEENIKSPLKVLVNTHQSFTNTLDVNFVLGVMATSTEDGAFYIWKIFQFELDFSVQLQNVEIMQISLMKHFPLLIVAEGKGNMQSSLNQNIAFRRQKSFVTDSESILSVISVWNITSINKAFRPICVLNLEPFFGKNIWPVKLNSMVYKSKGKSGNVFITNKNNSNQKRIIHLVVGLNNGNLTKWDISQYVEGIRPNFNIKSGYVLQKIRVNGQKIQQFLHLRQIAVPSSFTSEDQLGQDNLVQCIKCYRSDIIELEIFDIGKPYIASVNYRNIIKFWDQNGRRRGQFDIIQQQSKGWKLKINLFKQRKQLYLQAAQLLDQIQEAKLQKSKSANQSINFKSVQDFQNIKPKKIQPNFFPNCNKTKQYHVSLRQMDIQKRSREYFTKLYSVSKEQIKNYENTIYVSSDEEQQQEQPVKKMNQSYCALQLKQKLESFNQKSLDITTIQSVNMNPKSYTMTHQSSKFNLRKVRHIPHKQLNQINYGLHHEPTPNIRLLMSRYKKNRNIFPNAAQAVVRYYSSSKVQNIDNQIPKIYN